MVAVPVRVIDDEQLLEASLALAHTQLVGQLADDSNLDARTMGALGFMGALLAVAIAAKHLLGAISWMPLLAIGLATACCLLPALGFGGWFSGKTDLGPNPVRFYVHYGTEASITAREQLLADLAEAFARNARRLKAKQVVLRASLAILALGLLASFLAAGLPPSSHLLGCA
jgi:hypothetical protein